MSSLLVSAIVLSNVTFAMAMLGRTIQRSQRSKFRYEMWRVHDELVAMIESGEIRPTKPVLEYLDRVRFNVETTEYMTPFQFLVFVHSLRRTGWTAPADTLLARAEGREREVLREAAKRISSARVRLLLFGSPSGWLLCLCGPVLYLTAMLRQRRGHKPTGSPVGTVADWSSERYGSPIFVMEPVVKQRNKDRRSEDFAAYV